MNHDKKEVLQKMKGLWADAMVQICGADPNFFKTKKHQPCLYCGGNDRSRWTDKVSEPGDGGIICNQCGSGDGILWVQKLRGESFSESINALGDWLNLVPVEVIKSANIRASRTSPYKMGAQIDHERCVEIMERTERVESTPLSTYEGIYSEFGFDVGKTKSGELIHAIPCFMAYSDGISEEMCNVMFINEEEDVSYAAKDYTRQSVAVIGSFKDNEYAYLVDNFIDGYRVHLATRNRCVLVCYSSYNMEMVAYALKDSKLRIACTLHSLDLLAVADDRNIDVVIPNDEYSFKSGVRKRIYKASDLLNS
ncbi:putative DNA primase [Escherichia phage e4/1c]|uniref:Putative DNA primase n=1 Tax=Escherichia phage e4/1c TaxID=1495286 RepID=A0A023ZU75_9CAUD|nr:DNA primase [Escherichia phage e4/1c]AHY83187.1 putative DNA primase [Escherichia phage e4/1c]